MKIRNIRELKNLSSRRVLVRVDFNVPLKNGRVEDAYKIEQSLPTIRYLLAQKAKVILVSHLGRPDGPDKKLSLKPVAKILEEMLHVPVILTPLEAAEKFLPDRKSIILLENIRFHKGEERNDSALARVLSSLAGIFVLDGFAVAHRDAASVTGVARFLPVYAGLLLAKEIEGLSKATEKPRKPFVVVLGGAKMDTKIPVLKNLLKKADYILLGGGIVNTYWWAKGIKIGASIVDAAHKKEALLYLKNKKVVLPVDVVVGKKNGKGSRVMKVDKNFSIKGKDLAIFDVGPATVRLFAGYIKKANTLVWNGALGFFEQHPYEYGTYSVARLFAGRAKGRAFGICGGGETVEVLQKLHLMEDIDLVSTGGGAMLEFLSGKELPGVKVVGGE